MSRRTTGGLFLLMGLAFGGTFPAIRVGLADAPPLLLAAIRYDIAAVLLLAFVALRRDYWVPRTPADRRAVLAAGVFSVGGSGLLFLGQQFTTSGVAAVLFGLIPILTAAFAWALLPAERLGRRDVAGLCVGFLGVAVVVSPTPASLLAPDVVGKGLVLGAATSVALSGVLIRRADAALGPTSVTAWALLVGAGVIHLVSLAIGESPAAVTPTPRLAGALLWLALVASLGFAAYYTLLRRVGATRASLVSYMVPLVAAGVGTLVLDEPLAATTVVGFLVVLLGFTLLAYDELRAGLRRPGTSRAD
jgi:drug/metabolite transporter (DMT)-like permease